MPLSPAALPAWLASLTLASLVLTAVALLLLRLMRNRSAGTRRLMLAAVAFGLLWAALSRAVLPAWTPGFLRQTAAAVPLDAVMERVDRALEGHPVPLEVADRLHPPPAFLAAVQRQSIAVMPLLLTLWAAGALLCFFQRVRGGSLVWRIIRRAEALPPEDAVCQEIAAHCRAARMAMPRVKRSAAVSGPFTCGAGKAAWLVLPPDFSCQDAASRTAMLQHELAHLRHGDTILQVMLSLLVCVQWFNPLMHWLERRLRLECEKACDDAALQHAIAPQQYAELLLDLYQRAGRAPGLAATGGARTARRCREMMRDRVRSLANAALKRTAPGRRLRRVLALSALFGGSAIGATRLQHEAGWLFHIATRPLPAEEALVAHWALDSMEDPSMRPVSVALSSAGRIDAALAFNGTDSYVDLDPALVMNLQYPLTFCGWIRSTETTEIQTMIFAGNGRPMDYLQLGLWDGRAALMARRGGPDQPLISPQTIADGQWHHLAGVFHSAERRELFVDGALAASENVYRRRPSITRLQIGRNGRDELCDFLHGQADDIRLYSAALTAEELQIIMQGDRRMLAVPTSR